MKKVLFPLLFLSALLVPCFVQAELLIYKGTEKEVNTQGNSGRPVNWKVIVVIDHANGNFSRIRYATIDGVRRHFTLNETNSHILQIIALDGKTYTAVTRIPTECEAQEFPGGETVILKGQNVLISLSPGSTAFIPRILTKAGVGLSHSTTSGQPILDESSFVLAFDKVQTLASNYAGEGRGAAFDRLLAGVISLGY